MNEVTGVGLMLRDIDDMRNMTMASLAEGRASSFDEYRRLVGVIQGLNFATSVIRDVEDRLTRGEDDG
jgi:hypothetical protein